MMDILCAAILAMFALGAGLLAGAGNFGSFALAVIPGLIAGVLLAIPMMRDSQWAVVAIMVAAAIIGSLIATALPKTNAIRQFAQTQQSLVIDLGWYKLGQGK